MQNYTAITRRRKEREIIFPTKPEFVFTAFAARIGSTRTGSTRIGSTRIGSTRIGSSRIGSTRI